MNEKNFTSGILMVRPANFGFNPETAENNAFQSSDGSERVGSIREAALVEFDNLVKKIEGAGISVMVADDRDNPVKPDAVFPNNWFTTHADGKLITYPMYSPVRRKERDPAITNLLGEKYQVSEHIRLEHFESEDCFLEGTGSMIFDRMNKVVYACLSERTHKELIESVCEILGFRPLTFHAVDNKGLPVYHTNVIMTLGEGFVVICLECIPDAKEVNLLREEFEKASLEVVEISFEQVCRFAGNMLQLKNSEGENYLAMSTSAFNSLTKEQRNRLESYTRLLHSDISTIEKYGGGSVRCMIAENFLPLRNGKEL